jgi:hypothetical protein
MSGLKISSHDGSTPSSECVIDLEFMLLDVLFKYFRIYVVGCFVLNILEFIFGLCFGY